MVRRAPGSTLFPTRRSSDLFEWIGSAGGPSFDQISHAGGLATEVIEGILHRERAARVAQFSARHAGIDRKSTRRTPVTSLSRMPSSARKKKKNLESSSSTPH